jgi:hypothetical protein
MAGFVRVFDSLYNITCRGKRAFNTAVLIGTGVPSTVFPSTPSLSPRSCCHFERRCVVMLNPVIHACAPVEWASAYETSTFLLKYFDSNDAQALQDSIQLNIDFGATSSCTPSRHPLSLPCALDGRSLLSVDLN